tara:strand:- start:62451 stop:62612 length:162 start_codon:yes stop_codon:yes gene_type:complete
MKKHIKKNGLVITCQRDAKNLGTVALVMMIVTFTIATLCILGILPNGYGAYLG